MRCVLEVRSCAPQLAGQIAQLVGVRYKLAHSPTAVAPGSRTASMVGVRSTAAKHRSDVVGGFNQLATAMRRATLA